ncbi:MAG: LLM class F420-dependent oxidoreductase [Acidimicrobiia bacterium]|nr:LLM class F420-dependent oxidoreductase [Acidimicrobiia bacterium]
MSRYGMTVPFAAVPLSEHRDWFRELVDLGYTDAWSSESDGSDGFTPLALAAAWAPELRLGVAIIPAYTRGPALLAQSTAALASAAPGRFLLGIGSSSNVIVERWNGIAFDEPYKRTRDTLRFLKEALTGARVEHTYPTFDVQGFRLGLVPEVQPPILVAALREGMLRLAGAEGDGAIINWLSADDVRTVAGIVNAQGEGKEIVARIFVCPSTDADTVRAQARRAVAAYLNVPVYAEFHRWIGRGERLQGMWDAWAAGDRKAALDAIDDDVVDELIIHGPAGHCREQVARYLDNGVTTAALSIMNFGDVDIRQAVRDLAPR